MKIEGQGNYHECTFIVETSNGLQKEYRGEPDTDNTVWLRDSLRIGGVMVLVDE